MNWVCHIGRDRAYFQIKLVQCHWIETFSSNSSIQYQSLDEKGYRPLYTAHFLDKLKLSENLAQIRKKGTEFGLETFQRPLQTQIIDTMLD